jgi:hypothetical protein
MNRGKLFEKVVYVTIASLSLALLITGVYLLTYSYQALLVASTLLFTGFGGLVAIALLSIDLRRVRDGSK